MQIRDHLNKTTEYLDLKSGTYTQLLMGDILVASDTPKEYLTQKDFLRKAHGNVLIAGLGLGLIILPLQEKKEVSSISIVEKYQEFYKFS